MTKRVRRKLITAVITLAIAAIGGYLNSSLPKPNLPLVANNNANEVQLPAGFYRVTEFVDGDTLAIDMDGREERVRMIGVDTPETRKPNAAVQCFGEAASNFTKQLIGQSGVRLEADETNSNRDRYNRLLRYVYIQDGRLVNLEIIKQGYGFAYVSFPFLKLDEFRAAQTEAREQARGLWSSCDIKTINGDREQTNDVP